MKVLITGATGLLGKEIGKELTRRGHDLVVVSRGTKAEQLPFPCTVLNHDLTQTTITSQLIEEVEAVFHLAGENVGEGRWTKEKKLRIAKSRTETTKNLISSFASFKNLRCFVMAGAVGYYGNSGDILVSEDSPPGSSFLSNVCAQWEEQLFQNPALSTRSGGAKGRKVLFRLGVVLSPFGGMLEKIVPLFRAGLGTTLGNGNQWMSWIHINDATNLFCNALEDQRFKGVFNAVAPHVSSNIEFSRTLANEFGKGLLPAVPAAALRLTLGEKSALVLDSAKASAELVSNLFTFEYATLQPALAHTKACTEFFLLNSICPTRATTCFLFLQMQKTYRK